MIVIRNTSPLSGLLDLGLEHLLRDMYGEVLVPPAVYQEVQRDHSDLPAFMRLERIAHESAVNALLEDLDRGEAEAVVLAME